MGGLIMEKLILPLPSEGKKKKHPQSRNGSAAGDNNSIMEFVNKGVDGFQIIFVVGRRRRNIEHRVFDIEARQYAYRIRQDIDTENHY